MSVECVSRFSHLLFPSKSVANSLRLPTSIKVAVRVLPLLFFIESNTIPKLSYYPFVHFRDKYGIKITCRTWMFSQIYSVLHVEL